MSEVEALRRDVPLSKKARRLIQKLRGVGSETILDLKPTHIDALFRAAKARAGVGGFTFHDARHTAATWIAMSGALSPLELCKMFGWKDPKQAMTYFNPTAGDLADKL